MSLKNFLKSKTFALHLSLICLVCIILLLLTTTFLSLYTHHGKVYEVPNFTGLTQTEAHRVAQNSKTRLSIIDSLYVPDSEPGTIIGQYPVAGYRIKQNRTIFLTIAASIPELVDVPRVTDISLREAMTRLETAGLVVSQIIYKPSEFINLVLELQHDGIKVNANEKLPKGTVVTLTVGKGLSNEHASVPSVIGESLKDAEALLYNSSMNIGVLVYDESVINAEDSLNALIWKQNPAANNNVELGYSIDLWLTIDSSKIQVDEDIREEAEEEIDFEDFE